MENWKLVKVVKVLFLQQSWLAVPYGNQRVLRDGNIAHKLCQKYGIIGDKSDDLKLASWEFCILVNNVSSFGNVSWSFLWLSSCFNFYKPVKLPSLPITFIGVIGIQAFFIFPIRKYITLLFVEPYKIKEYTIWTNCNDTTVQSQWKEAKSI